MAVRHNDWASLLSCAAMFLGCSGVDPAQRQAAAENDQSRAPRGDDGEINAADAGSPTFDGAVEPAPPPRRRFDTLDQLLESCPSPAEVAEIHADIDVVFDPSVPSSIRCTQRGKESNAALSIDNIFRAMRLIRFDSALPPIGATNLYDWFKSTRITVHVFAASSPDSYSYATATGVHLNSFILSQPNKRRWVDKKDTVGLQDAVALLVHEARHTTLGGNKVHDCNGVDDSSFEYGGAWALQYNFDIWMAEHVLPGQSGSPLLTEFERAIARRNAQILSATSFCDAL